MKLLNLIFCFLLFNCATAQSVTFRCLEAEIFAKGCLTCDNSRTGKMLTGIELNITGTKTEFINPCVVKYDSLDNISIIDYRNVVKTFKRSQTSYSTATALLKDLGKCTTPDGQPIIDTLQFVNDTLGISLYGDSVAMYKVKILTKGSQKFDTIKYENDTLYLSLENDGVAVNKLKISSGTASKIDTFDIVSDTIRLSLNGDGEAYKKVNLKPYLDNTDNQALSISAGKGTISITSGGSVTLADSSATNEIQTVDTFNISTNTLRLSLSSDGQAFKSVDLSPYLDNTDAQSLYYGAKSGSTNYLNITSGVGVQINDGTGISISRDASNVITVQNTGDLSTSNEIQTVDTFRVSGGNLELSLSSDGVARSQLAVTQIAPVQSIAAGTGISVSGTNTITVTNTGDLSAANEGALTVGAGTGTTSLIQSNTSGSTNITLQASGIIALSENTGTNTITIDAVEVDGSTSNELQNITYGTKSGSDIPVNISSGTGVTLTEGSGVTLTRNSATQVTIAATGLTDGDKGDVDVSGSGSVWSLDTNAVMTIDVQDNAITNAKLADVPTSTFKGRTTAGTGDPEDLTVAQAKTLLNLSGTNTGDQTITLTSDVTGTGTGSFATTIASNVVTDAKLRQSVGLSVIGRSGSTTGNVADITAGVDGGVLRRSGTTLGFGSIATAGITNSAVTYAKIQNVAANSFLGNPTISAAAPSEIALAASQLAGRGSTGNLAAISLGGILSMSGTTLSATEVDGSTTNELQTYSHSGTTSYTNTLSNSGGSFTIQAGGINTISHTAGTVTITATEAQSLSYGTKSGSTIPLNISSGTGVNIVEGTAMSITRDASNQIIINNNGDISQKDTAYFFPETYGAIVNDANDDRAAIQSAIDAACARGGGIVWLRKGEYRITTTVSRGTYESGLHLCSNVYLMGTGYGSVINNKVTTSGKHIISLEHGGSNMTIQDIKIKSDSLPSGAAIYSNSGVTGVIVNHVQIDRGTCWGVFLKESSKCSILNSDIQNGGGCHCIELNNTNTTTVRNNWLYSNATKDYWPARGNGVEVFYDRNGTNRPYGNIIEANSIWGTGGGVVVWGDSLTTVSNNIIRLMEGHGIVVKRQDDAIPYYKSIGTVVEGNIIHGTGYANNSSLGILVDYDGTDIVLNGNKLDTILCDYAPSGGGTGIEVRAAGTVVNNNSIRHCAINGITLSAEADYSSVTGNSILDVSMLTVNGYKGISCSADNCTINSNNVHDLRGTKRMDICIYVPGNNNVVTCNNTSGAATGDNIYVTGTGNIEANNKD